MEKIKETKPIIFNDEYYKELIKKHNYNPVDFQAINFSLKNLDVKALEKKFVCHHHGDIFAKNLNSGKKSIITTGFGLSGNPHLGSISEMLKIIELQKAGLKTQVVLGDLDSYNARSQPLKVVSRFSFNSSTNLSIVRISWHLGFRKPTNSFIFIPFHDSVIRENNFSSNLVFMVYLLLFSLTAFYVIFKTENNSQH